MSKSSSLGPVSVTSFGSRVLTDETSHDDNLLDEGGPNPVIAVLARGGHWGTDPGECYMTSEAEIDVVCVPAKKCLGLPAT